MIGIVLVTHGRLGEELITALEHVVGPKPSIATIAIGPDDDMEERRQQILDRVEKADTGDGVAVLTDMFGGTPSNLAISLMDKANVDVIAGVNLPMLIKLVSVCETESLVAAAISAQEAGRKYITIASQLLNQDRK